MTFRKIALREKVKLPDIGETIGFEEYVKIWNKSYAPNTEFEVQEVSDYQVGIKPVDGKEVGYFSIKELEQYGYYLV